VPHKYETYRAQAKALPGGLAADSVSPYTIEVRFLGGLTDSQKQAFKSAADRWCTVIVGDLPSVMVDGEVIDDILILAEGSDIDGVNGILGQAGPTAIRPAAAGAAAFLPAKGSMQFDTADLAAMEAAGTLNDVITHEMGHVLGIGTVWSLKKLLKGINSGNPTFIGAQAKSEYGKLRGSGPKAVPVENTGGPGTANSHWRETVFRNELMSGFIAAAGNPLSRMTAGSLADLGYAVNLEAAEPYTLPNLLQIAEEGDAVAHVAPINTGIMLPHIPTVLPDDSLQ